MALGAEVASDAAGKATASWIAEDFNGNVNIRSASRPAGGNWTQAVTVGTMMNGGSFPAPQLDASRDGSVVVVQWASQTVNSIPNTAISINGQAFSTAILNSRNTQPVYVLAANHARASAFWTELIPARRVTSALVKQSDLQ